MAFLFGRNKQKPAVDLCRSTKDLLARVQANTDPKTAPRLEDELARSLSQMKMTLQGTPGGKELDTSPEQAAQLIQLLISEDVLYSLARNIHNLPFESRKDAQVVFSHALRYKAPNPRSNSDQYPALAYFIHRRPDLIISLCDGYQRRESAMPCGGILREALKHDSVAAIILYDEPSETTPTRALSNIDPDLPASGNGVFWRFFQWIDQGSFEVSADAFNTFYELLTKHKKLVSHFLLTNMQLFVEKYNTVLIQSDSYVTKRRSLNLLSTLLLERSNYNLMMRYVASAANLKLTMQLLRHDGRMVNYEAFHVFKIFTANPHKSIEVQKILINNRQKLLAFLPDFLPDRTDDVQFLDEVQYLIRTIEQLPSQPIPPQRSEGAISGPQSPQEQQQQHPVALQGH